MLDERWAGLDELRAVLAGKTCVFSGHSGVGKSSLANALLPGLDLRIGAVEDYQGQQTMNEQCGAFTRMPGGTRVIDTPAICDLALRE